MISRCTGYIPKQDNVFLRQLYNDSRYSQACSLCSQLLPGLLIALPDFSSVFRDMLLALPDMLLVLPGLPPVLPGAPWVVTRPPMATLICCWCFQVHLKAAASVQCTLKFDHPGILVQLLPDTPRGTKRHKYILLMSI